MEFGVYLNQYGDPQYQTTFNDLFEQVNELE
jgi:hypothetical protein